MVYNWLDRLQDTLFPPRCRLCGAAGAAGRDLCPGCHADLPWLGPACLRCALPLAVDGQLCGQCLQQVPAFDRVIAPFRYAPPLDYLVQRLKFHQDLAMARLLGQLLVEPLASLPGPRPAVILPVPLHRQRLAERGYNQALEIGRPLRAALGIPLEPGLAQRVRHTEAQSRLPARERQRNLRGAYVLGDAALPDHVALLDDVMTTGATVNELARLLKGAGVARVEVWVLARTASPGTL
jgi:ComF family protein